MVATQLRRRAAPELNRLLDMLDRSHKSLSELIDGVLLTEKLEAGKIEGHPVEIKLGQIMESALEAARGVAVQKGLAFESSYDPDRQIQVDPLLTRSAIQNLADNAAKFTDRGHIEVTVEDDGDDLIVHFSDTCQGLSPEELRTIFEPFERGATRKAGTGLGLAIARRAVEAQGGSIGAESPGQSGCHFWLRIPRRRPAENRANIRAERHTPSLPGRPSTRAMASDRLAQRARSATSCLRPTAVSSYCRTRWCFSEVIHSAVIQRRFSSRCSAGYSDPVSTRRTSFDRTWMAWLMP